LKNPTPTKRVRNPNHATNEKMRENITPKKPYLRVKTCAYNEKNMPSKISGTLRRAISTPTIFIPGVATVSDTGVDLVTFLKKCLNNNNSTTKIAISITTLKIT
jgi:hypothetical protein